MSTTNSTPEFEILNGCPIALAVFGHWMETGEPATVKDITAFSGLSESTVRKRIAAAPGGWIKGTQCTTVERPVYERNYGSVRHYRAVDAYAPERDVMREVIKALRMRNGDLARRCGEAPPELSERDAAEMHTN